MIIVMTFNLDSDIIQPMAREERFEKMKKAAMKIVDAHFRPEFIKRFAAWRFGVR